MQYAEHHDSFNELMMVAALDHLFDTVLKDELFEPDPDFSPSPVERKKMEQAKETADALKELFTILGGALNKI